MSSLMWPGPYIAVCARISTQVPPKIWALKSYMSILFNKMTMESLFRYRLTGGQRVNTHCMLGLYRMRRNCISFQVAYKDELRVHRASWRQSRLQALLHPYSSAKHRQDDGVTVCSQLLWNGADILSNRPCLSPSAPLYSTAVFLSPKRRIILGSSFLCFHTKRPKQRNIWK